MPAFGTDVRGGLQRRLYFPDNAPVLWWSLSAAFILVVLNGVLQFGFAMAIDRFAAEKAGELIQYILLAILPAGLVTALASLVLVRAKGGNARRHLALGLPELGWLGWIVIPLCFVIVVYVCNTLIVEVSGTDPQAYVPNQDEPGEAGLVKEAVFGIAAGPWFWLALPGIVFGAPLAEELTFRGQLFSSLASTRLGFIGTTIVTSALWSLLHLTEPLLNVAMVFVMGLLLGWLLVRFGSVWLSLACHGAWNLAMVLLVKSMVG
jgi:membrane protease YdiL (CAAX protease family)